MTSLFPVLDHILHHLESKGINIQFFLQRPLPLSLSCETPHGKLLAIRLVLKFLK